MSRLMLLAALCLVLSQEWPPEPPLVEVYRIEADDCASAIRSRRLTGFAVEGYDGILTALHGVVGCGRIAAIGDDPDEPDDLKDPVYRHLRIARVDIPRDVALLELTGPQGTQSRRLHAGAIPASASELWIFGYPQALERQFRTGGILLESANKRLVDLLGGLGQSERDRFVSRGSPASTVRVITLDGDIQPGHSGAPVFDGRGGVIGIGSGGLKGGTVGIGWAIPLPDLQLVSTQSVGNPLAELARLDAAAAFAFETDHESDPAEAPIWAQGDACLTPGQTYDLDLGVFGGPVNQADLFYENVDGVERYLRGWSSGVAAGGTSALATVTFADLSNATYGSGRFDASWGGGVVQPGTVWMVRTSEGRYAKLRILQSGNYTRFQWVTYARPGEGSLPSPVNSGPCSIEEELSCGAGALPGDTVYGFQVGGRQPSEVTITVRHAFNSAHGTVYVVPYLLDRNQENISGGYRPTMADPGGFTQVQTLYRGGVRARSAELFVYMFESGRAEAFVCRRFPYSAFWGAG